MPLAHTRKRQVACTCYQNDKRSVAGEFLFSSLPLQQGQQRMKPRTRLNEQIESLIAKIAEPLKDGTQKIGGFKLPDERQIAIQREDSAEINIWTEIFDTDGLDLQCKVIKY